MAAEKRVLIIGLDGFTWRLGRGFMAEGVMPRLAALVEAGCHGDLKSVMPFETSPAWSSFQTGCRPGKTGIFAFHRYDRATGQVGLNSFADNAMPSLWELASRAGKKVVSLNIPLSWPPPKVNGVIIPGLLCPNLSAQSVHPPQAYDKYIAPHKDYKAVNCNYRNTVRQFADQSIATEKLRCQVALELMNDVDWDIFCVQMQSVDLMQHRCWWALDQTAAGFDADRNKEALAFYRYCDEAIGRIVDAAGKDSLVLIVSDHGFCKAEGWVSINTWLKQNEYLHLVPPKPESLWLATKRKVSPLKWLARLYGYTARRLKKEENKPIFAVTDLKHMRQVIDFEKTKVICVGGMGGLIYIDGSIEERKELTKKLTDQIMRDLGPDSKAPAIKTITSGTEVYGTENPPDLLPDLVVEYKHGFEAIRSPGCLTTTGPKQVDGKDTGTHDRNGVLVVHGPGVKTKAELDGSIIDITPTVLAYLGIAVPRHIDGKVLDGAFTEPIKVNYEDMATGRTGGTQYTDAEQIEIGKRLMDMGYL